MVNDENSCATLDGFEDARRSHKHTALYIQFDLWLPFMWDHDWEKLSGVW